MEKEQCGFVFFLLICFITQTNCIHHNELWKQQANTGKSVLVHRQKRATPEDYLNPLNQARRDVNPPATKMLKLVWDVNLASEAQSIADSCNSNGLPDNVIAIEQSSTNIDSALQLAINAGTSSYNFASNTCTASGPLVCEVYKKITRADTMRVGCAKKSGCSVFNPGQTVEGTFFVCWFNLGTPSERPYIEGPSCTACSSGFECEPTTSTIPEGKLCIGKVVPMCPAGWDSYKEHCYRYFSKKLNWNLAQESCTQNGAILAEIEDYEENNWIKNRFPYKSFIGGSDLQFEGVWQWKSTGRKFGYSNWAHGEPDGSGDCLHYNWPSAGYWDDVPCSWYLPYICEKSI